MTEITSTPKCKGIPVELGGHTLVVPPLALGDLESLQEKIAGFKGDVTDLGQVSACIDVAHRAISRNYPEVTRADVAAWIDVANMNEVFEAVMDVSALKRIRLESAEAGEAKPAAA